MVIQTAWVCLGGEEVDGGSTEHTQNYTQIILFLQKNVEDNQQIKRVLQQMVLEQLDIHRQKTKQVRCCIYNQNSFKVGHRLQCAA